MLRHFIFALMFLTPTVCTLLNPFCGSRNVDEDEFRISGGFTVEKRSWPWMAEISHFEWRENKFLQHCGGTLIYPNWVISARHCFEQFIPKGSDDFSQLRVRLGVHDKTNDTDPDIQSFKVTAIINMPPPEGAETSSFVNNDIGLVRLDRPIRVDLPRMAAFPACLPEANRVIGTPEASDYGDLECHVLGWGVLDASTKLTADKLQQLEVRIGAPELCEEERIEHRKMHTFNPAVHLCAGHSDRSNTGSCEGDSGGPLICFATGRDTLYRLAGVYSRGYDTCSSKGIYMRITAEINEWIKKTVETVELKEFGAFPDVTVCKESKCKTWRWEKTNPEFEGRIVD